MKRARYGALAIAVLCLLALPATSAALDRPAEPRAAQYQNPVLELLRALRQQALKLIPVIDPQGSTLETPMPGGDPGHGSIKSVATIDPQGLTGESSRRGFDPEYESIKLLAAADPEGSTTETPLLGGDPGHGSIKLGAAIDPQG